jgi:CHAT domain-containing protein
MLALMPEHASMLYYVALQDTLVTWVVERGSVRCYQRPIKREELERQVSAYKRLMEGGSSERVIARASRALHELLIPMDVRQSRRRGALAIVPDHVLATLPFATLVDPSTGRYLIEDRPLTLGPSAAQLLRPDRPYRRGGDRELRAVLIGGNVKTATAERLGPLPHAAEELRDAAREYRASTILADEDATMDALRRAVPGASVLHFAGHAVANESFPWRSHLLLAPGEADGVANVDALSSIDFSGLRLVVLSACRTASGRSARGEGVISLTRPFLEQGVDAVVGTLWDADDQGAREALRRFHASYAEGRDAISALRDAQVALIKSDDAVLRHPASWGAFVVTATLR